MTVEEDANVNDRTAKTIAIDLFRQTMIEMTCRSLVVQQLHVWQHLVQFDSI